MTLGSLLARLQYTNKNLRFRKKTPFMGLHGPWTIVGLYKRLEYQHVALSSTDVQLRTKPRKYRKLTNLVDGKELIETVSEMERGRETFIKIVRSRGLIGRAGEQLMRL